MIFWGEINRYFIDRKEVFKLLQPFNNKNSVEILLIFKQ
jgi:hypothetical protein